MRRQSGFTTFTITLLLMLILLGISLLVGKMLVADRRVTLNEVLYRQAMAMAEVGLADGLGRLTLDPAWRTSGATTTLTTGSYVLSVADDPPSIAVGSTTVMPIAVSSTATLNDTQAEAVVRTKVVRFSVLAGTPAAPLTVAGGMAVGGNFTIVANPNGGGLGVPLSVWTSGNVDLITGTGQTCHQGDYDGGCSANISQKGDKQSDIKDNDTSFPTDLVWYLFNEKDDANGWANLEARATQRLTDCSSLGPASTGLIIVDGDCKPSANVGSETAPVILIVRNGNLAVNGNTVLYGLVFAYSSNPAAAGTDVKLTGGAIVHGAMVSNYQLGNANGTYDAKFDASVLSNISNGAAFQVVNQVPGSWRDW
ncbi:PilX N-terminal domain-containing pilus assembly protein [Aeromonas enterica]